MRLPFGEDEFFAVFQRYNDAVWPAPQAFYALAIGAVLALLWAGLFQSIGEVRTA
jgi:hypothetical protein